MALVPMKEILDEAERGNYGVPALNINEMLQLQAYLNAAFELRSPVILQASMGSRKFTGWLAGKGENADLGAAVTIGMVNVFLQQYKAAYGYDIPVAVTLDHGPDFQQCKSAIDSGFTSVMIDGSLDYGCKDANGRHPARLLDENIRITREVVEYAHRKGVTVEGELGTLGGIEDETAAGTVNLTNPEEVERFVRETGCDALAVAIGTAHGAYKFSAEVRLALDLVPMIRARAGDARLVMHGSSSVPGSLVDLVNQHPVVHLRGDRLQVTGFFTPNMKQPEVRTYSTTDRTAMARLGLDLGSFSCMKKSSGIPMEHIQSAIKAGIRKINVDTDGRIATTGAIRRHMADHPDDFDQRSYFKAARQALYDMAAEKMKGFGSAGRA